MESGQWVRLRGYGGQTLERRLVQETEQHLIVCTTEEFEQAIKEGRPPVAVGFPKDCLIDAGQPSSWEAAAG